MKAKTKLVLQSFKKNNLTIPFLEPDAQAIKKKTRRGDT